MQRFLPFVFLGLCLCVCSTALARNPFLSTPNNATEQQAPAVREPAPTEEADEQPVYRRVVGDFMRTIVVYQHTLKKKLTAAVTSLQDSFTFASLFLLLGGSFLYGTVHAAGPGHGKAAAAAYITACRGSLLHAMLLGLAIGVFHAASATILVSSIHFILQRSILLHFEESGRIMQLIGYGLITCIGLVLLVRELVALSGKNAHETHTAQPRKKSLLGTALVIGLVPCPGAALILIFALTLSAPLFGIASVAAMSLGMGCTIALVAATTSLCRSVLSRTLVQSPRSAHILGSFFGIAGSSIVVLFGVLMFSAALQS